MRIINFACGWAKFLLYKVEGVLTITTNEGDLMDTSKEKLLELSEQNPLEDIQTYNLQGKTFIVEPVFKKDSEETLVTVLLRLIQSDSSA